MGAIGERLRFWRPRRPVEVLRLSAQETLPLVAQILPVYGAAFAQPPYNRDQSQVQGFSVTLARHIDYRDFRCCVARESTGRVVGFTYGYTGERGQWWYDVVAAAMGADREASWLKDGFEFVELAVLPEAQGRGIGGRLHDALLEGQPHRAATLSTIQYETAALQLYRRRGWTVLLRDVIFPNVPEPYLIMGLDLRRWRAQTPSSPGPSSPETGEEGS